MLILKLMVFFGVVRFIEIEINNFIFISSKQREMSGWRFKLCRTLLGTRTNALRHLRTMHQPFVHHRCNRRGVCLTIVCLDAESRALHRTARCIQVASVAIIVASIPYTLRCRRIMCPMNIWWSSNPTIWGITTTMRVHQQALNRWILPTWIAFQHLRNPFGQMIRRKRTTSMAFNISLVNIAYGSHVVKLTHSKCASVWTICGVSGHVHGASYRFGHHKVWPHICAICTKVLERNINPINLINLFAAEMTTFWLSFIRSFAGWIRHMVIFCWENSAQLCSEWWELVPVCSSNSKQTKTSKGLANNIRSDKWTINFHSSRFVTLEKVGSIRSNH